MLFRGLKTKIAMNIAILLFVAMVLLNLVIVMTSQRDLIQAEVSKADVLLSWLEDYVLSTSLWK